MNIDFFESRWEPLILFLFLILSSWFCEELNDESGNPIWKNRVESWKDKKNKKKRPNVNTEQEAQIPPQQQMEEKQ